MLHTAFDPDLSLPNRNQADSRSHARDRFVERNNPPTLRSQTREHLQSIAPSRPNVPSCVSLEKSSSGIEMSYPRGWPQPPTGPLLGMTRIKDDHAPKATATDGNDRINSRGSPEVFLAVFTLIVGRAKVGPCRGTPRCPAQME